MPSGFTRDPSFEAMLLRSTEIRDVLEERVTAAATRAAGLAPDDPATTTNDLHTSVFGEVALTGRGWAGRVGATNFKAPWFEVGATGVPARPFLVPAVEQEVGPIEGDPGVEE